MTYYEGDDSKSVKSYRSTHSTRSSVLERAREYNARLAEQKTRRSKSLERTEQDASSFSSDVLEAQNSSSGAATATQRSQSAGRLSSSAGGQGNRPATRERAMASLQREENAAIGTSRHVVTTSATAATTTTKNTNAAQRMSPSMNSSSDPPGGGNFNNNNHTPRSRLSVTGGSAYSSHVSRPQPTTPRTGSSNMNESNNNSNGRRPGSNPTPSHHMQQQQQQQQQKNTGRNSMVSRDSPASSRVSSQQNNHQVNHHPQVNNKNRNNNNDAVVTPELLVDALSGHEDGLLAIAERLMEHYDSGYDVMGEAIIDAFADVQKLFQHVVEAAHMEGAAFEASRREEEMTELRKQVAAANSTGTNTTMMDPTSPTSASSQQQQQQQQPTRHDEFIDQDVKDILSEAIRDGANYRNAGKFTECFHRYEGACQSASSLLPVDSDHRGRLQLSIARAESMSHERACAILRYAMDDVLRSGLRAGQHVPLPDPSQRADVVLNRSQAAPGTAGLQSSEEALNSLVEEMREVMNAPVYNNTPLQSVAHRFLAALSDAQKTQQKNAEKLEQNLAKLKGDFLLARAEWEEKLNSSQETAEVFKEKYNKLKQQIRNAGDTSVADSSYNGGDSNTNASAANYLEHARSALASQQQRLNDGLSASGVRDFSAIRPAASRAGSQVSLSSGLANHARSIVGSFACVGGNQQRTNEGVPTQEYTENRDAEIREMAFRHDSGMRDRDRRRTQDKRNSGASGNHANISMSYSDRSFMSDAQSQSTANNQRRTPHSVASGSTRSKSSRSFREYSRSPQRVDF